MGKLLTVREASKESGVAYRSLLDLIRDGKLRTVAIPGRQFPKVDPVDLWAVIETWKSGSLSGSSETSQVGKLQHSSAQNEKSRYHNRGKIGKGEVAYYVQFRSKSSA